MIYPKVVLATIFKFIIAFIYFYIIFIYLCLLLPLLLSPFLSDIFIAYVFDRLCTLHLFIGFTFSDYKTN